MEKMTDSLWQDYHISAKMAGCPLDQIESFTKALYIATPQQLAFHSAARAADLRGMPNKLAMGGTRGSAKSHSIIAQVGLDDCLRQPQLKALFLRKTQKAAGEQFQDLIDKVFNNVNCSRNTQRILFPNGSKIVIGGYKDPKEIDNYIGIEYDVIYIGEITQIPGDRVEKLLGSLRTSKTNWRPRLYTDFNPGGLGYQAVKKIFIDPWRDNSQSDTQFFETWYQDNPFINPEYRAYLDNLKGPLKEIWCLNNWNIMAGQAFPELDYDIHGFTEEKPSNWPVVVVYDWGYEKPYAVCFIRIDYDNRGWVFHEIYGHGGKDNVGTHESIEEVAARVAYFMEQNKLSPIAHLAGPDFFARSAGSGMMQPKSYAEVFADYGIHMSQIFTPAGSRIQGKMLFHSRLAVGESGQPGLKIHLTNCPHTWRTLMELTYLEDGSGDVNSDEEDHCLVGETLVLTQHGWKRIDQIPEARVTGHNLDILELTTETGEKLRCTPNHRILTNAGWLEAQELKPGSEILWLYPQLSNFIAGKIITYVDHIFKNEVNDYTEKSTLTITGKLKKAITSTILTVIHRIIKNKISFVSLFGNTLVATPNIQRKNNALQGVKMQLDHGEMVTIKLQGNKEVRRLVSVTNIGKIDLVYDLSIDNQFHAFIVNDGFIVHNCYDALRHFCSWRQWIKPIDSVIPDFRRPVGMIDLKSIVNKKQKSTSRRLG